MKSYLYEMIAGTNSVMLHFQHYFCNMIFKITHKLHIEPESTNPPLPHLPAQVKNFACPSARSFSSWRQNDFSRTFILHHFLLSFFLSFLTLLYPPFSPFSFPIPFISSPSVFPLGQFEVTSSPVPHHIQGVAQVTWSRKFNKFPPVLERCLRRPVFKTLPAARLPSLTTLITKLL